MIHHGKDTGPLQVQIGVYVYNRITADFYLVVRCLKMELLDGGSVGGCVVFGEISDVGSNLYSQHLLGYFGKQVQVMV